MNDIEFKITSTGDWSTISKAHEFAEILTHYKEFLLPEKYDSQEPERYKFIPSDLSEFIDRWTSHIVGFHMSRKIPYSAFMLIDIWKKEHNNFNSIIACFDTNYFQNINETKMLLKSVSELYEWGRIDHGYICHREDWINKNKYYAKEEYDPIGRPLPRTGGNRLSEGIPGIYWANYFGPIYVEFFGREKFLSAPAYCKEELPDGGFMLLTSETPFEYSKEKVQKLENDIMNNLGRNAFFEKSKPEKICTVPKFDFKQEKPGHPIQIYACDEIQYAISEPKIFIGRIETLIVSLQERLKKLTDISFDSLPIIDNFIKKESKKNPIPWELEKGKQIVQELTAFYGEVFRRHVNGEWAVRKGSAEDLHPVVLFKIGNHEYIEYPFTRVYKFWFEQDRADALTNKFHVAIRGF